MAAILLHVSIQSAQVAPFLRDLVTKQKKTPVDEALALRELLDGIIGGNINARMQTYIDSDSGAASAFTIACTRANATTNYVAICAAIATGTVTTTDTTYVLTLCTQAFVVNAKIGDIISGTGIPLGTTIVGKDPEARTITMSAAATATATVTATVYQRDRVFLEGTDFLRGADDTATGDNLAAAINANISAGGTLAGLFTSVLAAAGTITLTALMKSVAGQQITIATDDATAFAIVNSVVAANGVVNQGATAYGYGVTP